MANGQFCKESTPYVRGQKQACHTLAGTSESRPSTQQEDGAALWGAKPAQEMVQDPTNSLSLKADGNGYGRVWRRPARSEAASRALLTSSGPSSSPHRPKDTAAVLPLRRRLHTLLRGEPPFSSSSQGDASSSIPPSSLPPKTLTRAFYGLTGFTTNRYKEHKV